MGKAALGGLALNSMSLLADVSSEQLRTWKDVTNNAVFAYELHLVISVIWLKLCT